MPNITEILVKLVTIVHFYLLDVRIRINDSLIDGVISRAKNIIGRVVIVRHGRGLDN